MIRVFFLAIALSCIVHVNCYRTEKEINDDIIVESEISDPPPNDSADSKARRSSSNYNKQKKSSEEEFKGDKIKAGTDTAGTNTADHTAMVLRRGLRKIFSQNNIQSPALNKLTNQLLDFFKSNIGPGFRSNKYGIQSEVVHLKNEKPTVKIEMNPQMLVGLINDFLKSDSLNDNIDKVIKQIGVMYRAFSEDDIS